MQKDIFRSFYNLNKKKIINSFDKAAYEYDKYAVFQRICGNMLCNLINNKIANNLSKHYLLDVGCGTGWFSRKLKKKFTKVIAFDISNNMLDFARKQNSANFYVLGDMEKLPIATCSVDIIFSNLAVQWCHNLSSVIHELYRVLKPGGILALSTLAKGSLYELEYAWKNIDNYIHINNFLKYDNISAAFSPYRHELIKKLYLFYYKKIMDLLKEIKGVGASYIQGNKFPGLISKRKIQALEGFWPQKNLGLTLSYNVVYGVLYRD